MFSVPMDLAQWRVDKILIFWYKTLCLCVLRNQGMEPETENGSECEGIMEDGAGQGNLKIVQINSVLVSGWAWTVGAWGKLPADQPNIKELNLDLGCHPPQVSQNCNSNLTKSITYRNKRISTL